MTTSPELSRSASTTTNSGSIWRTAEPSVATLASGLPKIRNEDGAHGQGAEVRAVPPYVAEYALDLAAPKIRFVALVAGLA
jgi:hypothetical protein